MRTFYPVCQVAELAAGYRDMTRCRAAHTHRPERRATVEARPGGVTTRALLPGALDEMPLACGASPGAEPLALGGVGRSGTPRRRAASDQRTPVGRAGHPRATLGHGEHAMVVRGATISALAETVLPWVAMLHVVQRVPTMQELLKVCSWHYMHETLMKSRSQHGHACMAMSMHKDTHTQRSLGV